MELIIVDQIRLKSTVDGRVWSTGWGGYSEFETYRAAFERVSVACRLEPVSEPGPGARRCDGPGVSFLPLPYYVGPAQYLRAASAVRRRIHEMYRPGAAYLLRMPSQLASLFMGELSKRGHPFGVIVVADPRKGFERRSCGSPAWFYFRWRYTAALRESCASAVAVAYVTSAHLQGEYPPGRGLSMAFSDVNLTDESFAMRPRVGRLGSVGWDLLHVGSFNLPLKGQDTLLRAVAICRKRGFSVRLTCVGGGRYLPSARRLASSLCLDDVVTFAGEIPSGSEVRTYLDAADLFVLPSRTEGLPRALLEAMARGVPCVATNVGGIPELLDHPFLVPPDRPDLLADRVIEVLARPGCLSEMSSANLSVARRYRRSVMAPLRRTFLERLRTSTEQWISGHAGESPRVRLAESGML